MKSPREGKGVASSCILAGALGLSRRMRTAGCDRRGSKTRLEVPGSLRLRPG